MKYLLLSETKNHKVTDLEEIIYLLNEKMDTEQFLVIDRQKGEFSETQDYMQTTINTGDEHLFWVEARLYHSDNLEDFSHYRLKCDDLEPVMDAFTSFFNETVDYQQWENVTAEFK